MSEIKKQSSNEAENGNKSKPLLSSRLFKFRFYDTELKKILYRNPLTYDFCVETIIPMQFTGLIDCKGREIFAGDILEYNIYCYDNLKEQYRYVVNCGMPDYSEVFGIYNILKHFPMFTIKIIKGTPDIDIIPRNYTVIGNIFENPELLEAVCEAGR